MAKQQDKKAKPKQPRTRRSPKITDTPGTAKAKKTPFAVSEESPEQQRERGRTRHAIQGIVFGALTLLLFVSLLTYHPEDFATQGPMRNIAGLVGALVSEYLFRFFGYIAYVFPVMTLLFSIDRFQKTPRFSNYGNIIGSALAVFCLCALLSLPSLGEATRFSPGGFIGVTIAAFLVGYLKVFGSITVLITGLIIAGLLLNTYLFRHLIVPSDEPLIQDPQLERFPEIFSPQKKTPPLPKPKAKAKNASKSFRERLGQKPKKKAAPKSKTKGKTKEEVLEPTIQGYELPSPSLLNKPPTEKMQAGLKQNLLANSKILEEKLLDFGIEGQVVGVLPGPVITRYEFQPAPGVKVSRIVNLSDDLALGMKAVSIRIEAPVPGKDVVGIEVPNDTRETVYLRDLVESENFLNHDSRLALAIGKDIGGHPYFADLGKMPHLLIAGATGSGKSVCLNTLICSILFHATPHEVRFIMVDPKMLELGVYDNIPHLLIPVVKDPQKASNALKWATEEMTRRYSVLAQKGVRNIAQYNDAIQDFREHQHPGDAKPVEEPLPYIVIIVDELADLMMVASGVEKPITRLAQMARAVGIHLILATQRPSVDVITGVIKANFPARISFRVSSKVDSRTILDANGAELLLGDGDMLFLLPGTSRIRRLHGSFLSEKEIKRLTTALKKMGKPSYDQAVLHYTSKTENGKDDDDELVYRKAVQLVVNHGEASVSLLRRSLKIGHSKAARLIDMMEGDGIVGGFKGSRPRDILVSVDQLDERFRHADSE